MSANRALRGRVQITATSAPAGQRRAVVALLEAPPEMRGGMGGWEEAARPQQRPSRWWSGQPGLTLTLQLILDCERTRDGSPSVEARLLLLTAFGRRQANRPAPSPVRLSGDVRDPYSARGGLWVIADLSLGERVFHRDGRLRRQHLTLELEDFAPVNAVRALSVRRTRAGADRPRARTVTVRRGDTLRAIAVRELGSVNAWQAIRQWNPGRFRGRSVGPDEPLRPGIRLVLR